MPVRSLLTRARLAAEHGLHFLRECIHEREHDTGDVEVSRLESRVLFSVAPVAPLVEDVGTVANDTPESLESTQEEGTTQLDSTEATRSEESILSDLSELEDLIASGDDALIQEEGEASTDLGLVFVDSSIANWETLVTDVERSAAQSGYSVEIIVLDSDTDGLAQIGSALSERSDVGEIHIVSHGSEGTVRLGSTTLTSSNLSTYESAIRSWQRSLSADADILFYGCNLAATSDGQAMLQAISEWSEADVAASDDLTGHEILGGDWELEFTVGEIAAGAVFSVDVQADWQQVLATITVTTTDDNDTGDTSSIAALLADDGGDGVSLREAIIAANNTSGADTIAFNIAGAGPHTINLGSELNTITDTVTIDGWSEPDYASTPVIELNGVSAGVSADGLRLGAGSGGSTIRGLIINRFGDDGIQISAGSDGNTIVGNWIGIGVDGVTDLGNSSDGIEITSANNIIGGTTAAERNVISGNNSEGISVDGVTATGNIVVGNYIGTDVTGTAAVGNTSIGIHINSGASNNQIGGTATGERNVISGNLNDGLVIGGTGTSGNIVQGNYIGVDVTGIVALANGDDGIQVELSASGNLIGGLSEGAGNVVAGNLNDGIQLSNSAFNNTIQGNIIGLGSDGTTAIGNANSGVLLTSGAHDNLIGGSTTAARNIIGSNDEGVRLTGGGTDNNIIRGNYIGTDISGTLDRGALDDGVDIGTLAANNIIGGTGENDGNVIAHSAGDGIEFRSDAGTGNSILGNAIFGSGGDAIDFNQDGVTPNDIGTPGDADAGPNNQQNFPVLTGAFTNAADTVAVSGTINTTAYTSLRIEFFAEFGGSATYLGFVNVITDSDGNATFLKSLSAAIPPVATVTATATNLATGDTSEMSASIGMVEALAVSTTNDVVDGNTSSVANLLATRGADGEISLREAIIATNNTVGYDAIFIPTGTYTTTIGGTGEEFAATGDLDIRDNLVLIGDPSGTTTLNGGGIDRLLHVQNSASAYVTGITITGGNVVGSEGAGIRTAGSTSLVISDTIIQGNTTDGDGGGIYALGDVYLNDVWIDNNTAQLGGGIGVTQKTVITNSTISANVADFGGGVRNAGSQADLTMLNVTLSGNTATTQGGGLQNGKDAELLYVTVTGNEAAQSGGVHEATGGSITNIRSSIIAGNTLLDGTTADDVGGGFESSGYNIIGNVDGTTGWDVSDQTGTLASPLDPMLDSLLNNGGFVPTHALLAGSPAINSGDPTLTSIAIDARGELRLDGSFDIGAVEFAADGLVGHYKLDEGSGTTAVDSSGYGSNGTHIGSPTYDTGVSSSAVNYSEDFDRTEIADPADGHLDFGSGDFSVSFWFNSTQNTPSFTRLVGKTAGTAGFIFYRTNGDLVFEVTDGSNLAQTFATDVMDGDWHHVVGVRDGSAFSLYIDGVVVSTDIALVGSIDNSEALKFGATSDAASDYDGLLDEVRLYGRSLSYEEVLALDEPNTAPVNSVPGAQATAQDTDLVFSTDNSNAITLSDPDAGDEIVELTLAVDNGTLTLNTSGATGVATQVNTIGGIAQPFRPDVAFNPDGSGYVITFSDYLTDGDGYGVWMRRYDASGTPISGQTLVNTTTAGQQNYSQIAMDDAGNFVIVWRSLDQEGGAGNNTWGIYAQRYNASGTKIGSEFQVNSTISGDQDEPRIAMDASGNFVIVWQGKGSGDDPGIFLQRYDSSGVAQGGETLVNTTVTGTQSDASVAMDDAGNFVVTWSDTDSSNVYMQRFNALGAKVGGQVLVNTTTTGTQNQARVAMSDGGQFAIVWHHNDGSGDEIYLQRFDALGTALGSETLISTANGTASLPTISMDGNGNFVVAWRDGGPVVGRSFLADGTPRGEQFEIDNAGTLPEIALADNGRFVAAWDEGDIFKRDFDTLSLTFTNGDGIDDATLTVQGTLTDLNKALDGLIYTPGTGYNGYETLTVTTNDLGNTGSGGAQQDVDTVAISVGNPNAPVIDLNGSNAGGNDFATTWTEGGGTILLADTDSTVTDADENLTGMTVTITNLLDGTAEVLAANTSGTSITAVYNNGTGELALTGADTAANYQQVLRTITYDNTSDAPDATARVITFTPIDSLSSGNTATTTLAIVATNDPPINTVPSAQTTAQDTDLVFSTGNTNAISISDADADANDIEVTLSVDNGTLTLGHVTEILPATLANTTESGSQLHGDIGYAADGSYVIVWEGADVDGRGIYAQRFDATGTKVGGEIPINVTTTNNQTSPSVSVAADGSFTVAWGESKSGRQWDLWSLCPEVR